MGAIATLIITILSGVAVFYLTRSPQKEPSELLRYSIDQSASFESKNNRVALVKVMLINQGDAKAENIVGSIEFPAGVIKDKKIVASSGDVSGFSLTAEKVKGINFMVPRLFPKERISITFLLESTTSPKPSIHLKSNKSIGEEVSLFNMLEKDETKLMKDFLSSLMPFLFGLSMILFLLFLMKKRLASSFSRGSSLNNNGFVFLHNGLNDLAAPMLSEAVSKGVDSPYAIYNYATCLAVQGEMEKAKQYLSAGDFLTNSPQEKAVAAFNHGIISFLEDNTKEGTIQFEQALKLSRKEILLYLQKSTILATLMKKHPEIESLISSKSLPSNPST